MKRTLGLALTGLAILSILRSVTSVLPGLEHPSILIKLWCVATALAIAIPLHRWLTQPETTITTHIPVPGGWITIPRQLTAGQIAEIQRQWPTSGETTTAANGQETT